MDPVSLRGSYLDDVQVVDAISREETAQGSVGVARMHGGKEKTQGQVWQRRGTSHYTGAVWPANLARAGLYRDGDDEVNAEDIVLQPIT